MTSHVLHGRLTNVTWPELLIGFGQPLYYTQIEEGRSFLHRTPVELTLGPPRAETVTAGNSYVVPKGIVHDTRVAVDETCVTMCLFHTDRSGKSLVVGAADAADRIETNRLNLSPAEAEQAHALCRSVLEQLTPAKSAGPKSGGRARARRPPTPSDRPATAKPPRKRR